MPGILWKFLPSKIDVESITPNVRLWRFIKTGWQGHWRLCLNLLIPHSHEMTDIEIGLSFQIKAVMSSKPHGTGANIQNHGAPFTTDFRKSGIVGFQTSGNELFCIWFNKVSWFLEMLISRNGGMDDFLPLEIVFPHFLKWESWGTSWELATVSVEPAKVQSSSSCFDSWWQSIKTIQVSRHPLQSPFLWTFGISFVWLSSRCFMIFKSNFGTSE